MCEPLAALTVVPSPKSITVAAIEPSESADPAVVAVTVAGSTAFVGVTLNAATGAWLALGPAATVPSPKSICELAVAAVCDAIAIVAVTFSGAAPLAGVAATLTAGAW